MGDLLGAMRCPAPTPMPQPVPLASGLSLMGHVTSGTASPKSPGRLAGLTLLADVTSVCFLDVPLLRDCPGREGTATLGLSLKVNLSFSHANTV